MIREHFERIVDTWSACPSLLPVIEKLQLDVATFRSSIATPVLAYLVSILEGENAAGDCPVMRRVVETFHSKGLAVEDVYLNCTGLKNAIVELCFEKRVDVAELNRLIHILDRNLYRVLSIYTDTLLEHERSIQHHRNIIEEYVLMTTTDPEGRITHVTEAFCNLTGFSKSELLHNSHALIRHQEMDDEFFRGMWKRIQEGKVWKGKVKNMKKDGGSFIAQTEIIPVFDGSGRLREYMAIRHDITDREISRFDPLTNLYNRRSFESVMGRQMERTAPLTLLLMDIDHFKSINDTYGHAAGDAALIQTAELLQRHTRPNDICCRWGGEEFVVLLPGASLRTAIEVAERIRTAVGRSLMIDEAPEQRVTCSIGVAERREGDDARSLFKRADDLLYRAKGAGRDRVVCEE